MPTQSSGYKPVLIEDIDAVQGAIIQLEVGFTLQNKDKSFLQELSQKDLVKLDFIYNSDVM